MLCQSYLLSQSNAHEIIASSIAFHDPDGALQSSRVSMTFAESRPNGNDRKTIVSLHPSKESLSIERWEDGQHIKMHKSKKRTKFRVNGRKPTEAQKTKYRLNDERLDFIANYYRYLWMAPHILNDPGTIIEPSFNITDFFGTTALEVKVTYDPSVGEDIWYFYFDQTSRAMIGYRFYHDEEAGDGEYILLSGLATTGSTKIPQTRKWMTHQGDKHLGTDKLVSFILK
jgi:hypothetical protein